MEKITLVHKKLVFTISFLFVAFYGISQTSQTFNASGNFIIPAGVTSIQVEAWGAGGKGGSKSNGNGTYGGGGGGAYSKNIITVTAGLSYPVTVGIGSASNTSPGGDSWFSNGTSIIAKGGSSVSNNNNSAGASGGSSASGIGAVVLFGGNGANSGTDGGGGGSSAGTTLNGVNATNQNGAIAPSGGGNGGNAISAVAAVAGSSPGGGGGGGKNNDDGANGANGKVIITWTCPTTYKLSSTTVANAVCSSNSANVAVSATGTELPIGIYAVTYNLSAPNLATGNTVSMTVTTAGMGSFASTALPNTGTTTLTITNLTSGDPSQNNCSSAISINNTVNITVNAIPTITSTVPNSRAGSGTVVLGATASAGIISWFSTATGGSALATGSSFTTPAISTTTTYYVETTNASCTSFSRIAVTATVNLPEINISGNATLIIDGDTTPSITDWTIFGSMETSTGIITKKFTIQNTGTATLSIGPISILGSSASDFTITTNPSASISPGGSSTFLVSFNPTTLGLKTASLSIVNDDSNENPYDFSIQGTGIQTFFDSDGDGVYDNFDIDDDNDGILDATEEVNCNNSNGRKVDYKFLNETFGTGGRTSSFTAAYNAITTYCYEDGIVGANTSDCPSQSTKILDDGEYTVVSKITGATADDPNNIHGDLAWYNGEDHTTGDTEGRMAVFNASFTPGTFYETTITGILSNLPITYSFWVLNIMAQNTFPNSILPNVTVEFYDLSNNLLNSFNTGDIGRCSGSTIDNTCAQGVWKQFTTNVNLGNVNAFTIRFKNNAPGGGGNDLALDDILISQTLCDLDNDGVADMFDLDADNDGIEDVIEVGLGNLSDGKGKIATTWVDNNGNGLHDNAERSPAIVPLDSDGDGIPNYIDLDSDNDSLFDVDESGAGNTNAIFGYQNGDGDINGDGVGDGRESETFRNKDINGDGIAEGFGDGILDIYDYGTGINQYGNLGQGIATANSATTYLKDTDSNGIPDYLDVKSNGSTFDIANTIVLYNYKTLDTNNDGIIDGKTDVDKDGILDIFDTNTALYGSPRDIRSKLFLDFDGRNDYGQSSAILGGLANASLMAWINLNPNFNSEGVIVGQNNFQIRITAARKLEAVINGTSVLFDTTLNVSQWYNIGVIYDGSNIKLYLNGTLAKSQAKTGNISTDASLLTLGRDPSTTTKYFKGKIDEVRVFNLALTESQLQRMVYQEIQDVSSQIRGFIVPKNVASAPSALPFSNLLRYYRMDSYKDDIIDDLTTPAIDMMGTKIYNHKNIYVQQAPMPFITERNGSFATAVNSPSKEIRGDDIMEQDWSIVQVKHDITETANNIDLGMLVDAGKNIIMNNDTKLQNDWYLKLEGKIDLTGMAQLVQTAESDLDVTSSGSIERDQQGQSNLYNYNYWSSPVSPINTTTNNTNYSVSGSFKDGTDPATPKAINWIGGYDGAPTSPINLARYWLYKFDNYANNYANWVQITENSSIRVGQGFTLKGSGSASGTQNYTFSGKPNNGSVTTNHVGPSQLLLTGNPYPSALDAKAFINANINSNPSTDGTLYFWEHYASNKTHILRDYQGGYAVRNLTGGLAPSAAGVDFISQAGTPSRGIPNQFVPVGQGFFVIGQIGGGGPIIFNNNQRGFHKENDDLNSNVLYRTKSTEGKTWDNNNNDPVIKDTYKKIRLGFNSHTDHHRQVLLGFMEDKATSVMDYGYDGLNIDNFPNDMYFLNGENQLVIQGDGYFDRNAFFPIGVKTDAAGKVKFLIDALENFDANQPIFIYDDQTKIYHNIRNEAFEIDLTAGEHHSRFSLRFKGKSLIIKDKNHIDNEMKIIHSQSKNMIIINNSEIDTIVQEVTLFNITGQSISSWKIENQGQQDIQLPIKKISSGVYVVKLKTSKGEVSKKIIIK